jgi:kynureninase
MLANPVRRRPADESISVDLVGQWSEPRTAVDSHIAILYGYGSQPYIQWMRNCWPARSPTIELRWAYATLFDWAYFRASVATIRSVTALFGSWSQGLRVNMCEVRGDVFALADNIIE